MGWHSPASCEAEATAVDLFPGLLVEDSPFWTARHRRPSVGREDSTNLVVYGFFQPGLIGQHPADFSPEVIPPPERNYSLNSHEFVKNAPRKIEGALPAELHRMNPRSRASFTLTRLKSRV